MVRLRFPPSSWAPSGTALVALLAVAPLLTTLLLAPSTRGWSQAATITQLLVAPLILGAALVLYARHRLAESPASAWTTLCLTVYGVENAVVAGLRAAESGSSPDGPGWALLVDLGLGLGVLAAVGNRHRFPARVDPLAVGLATGISVGGLHLYLNALGPGRDLGLALVAALLTGAWVTACLLALRADRGTGWFSARFAIATGLLVVNHLAASRAGSGHATELVCLVSGLAGAVLLVSVSLDSLRFAILVNLDRLRHLQARLADLEAHDRDQRARLHEVANSVAGIAGASALIHREERLSEQGRHQLEEMLDLEAARLARILRAPTAFPVGLPAPDDHLRTRPASPGLIDVDAVVRPLVVAQRAIGRDVRWHPSGLAALGDPDDLSEALNVLMDNARKHAPGATTTVTATQDRNEVHITVSDDGPGIAAAVADRLFEWGERGPGSTGEGLGLALARTRIHACDGRLRVDAGGCGATFVATLPALTWLGGADPAAPPGSTLARAGSGREVEVR